jgi:hypothetical protein
MSKSEDRKRKKIEALAADPRTDPATRAAAAAKAKELRVIHRLEVQVAKPGGSRYPYGRTEETWWFLEDDVVWLCDSSGVRTGDHRRVPEDVEPKVIAILLLKSRAGRHSGDFNRPLHYQRQVF